MTNLNEKVAQGEDWKPRPAETHNTLVDVAIAHKRGPRNERLDIRDFRNPTDRHCLEIDAVCDMAVKPYTPVTIGDPIAMPNSVEKAVQHARMVVQVRPSTSSTLEAGKWGVLRRGAMVGGGSSQVVPVVVRGYTWLKVRIVNALHNYCESDGTKICSAFHGHGRIIERGTIDGFGDAWCLVNIGETEIERIYFGTAPNQISANSSGTINSDNFPDGENKTVSATHIGANKDENIPAGSRVTYVLRIDGTRVIIDFERDFSGGSTNVCSQITAYPTHDIDQTQLFYHGAGGTCAWVTFCDLMKTLPGFIDYTIGGAQSYARNQYFVIQPDGTCNIQAFNFCLEAKKSVFYDTQSDVHQFLCLTPFQSPNGGLECTWQKFNICDEIKKLFGQNITQDQLILKKKDVSGTPGACELVTFCDLIKGIDGYSPGQTRRQFVSVFNQACDIGILDLCTELKLGLTGHSESKDQWIGHDANSSICKWVDKPVIGLLKATVTSTTIPPGGTGNLNLGGNTVTGRWQWADGDWTLQNGCEVWIQHVTGTTYDIVTTNDCTKVTRP